MEFICDKNLLSNALQIVQKATATKTTTPLLTGIYIATNIDQLELQATDYEIGIKISIPARIIEAGKIVISGKILPDIVRKIDDQEIRFVKLPQQNLVYITSGNIEFKILSFPEEEFPTIKSIDCHSIIDINDTELKELIKKTVFACSTDESRPLFTGALLEITENGICMVATNTHRLALKKIQLKTMINNTKVIVPGKILSEILKFLTYDHPVNVKLGISKNQISFEFENIYVVSRVIEGNFPDYNKVIPSGFTSFFEIDSNHFYDSVERVSLLAKDGEFNIIKINIGSTKLEITGNNPDAGSAIEIVNIVLDGESFEIAFNAKYLMDILKIASNGRVKVNLKNALSPVIIHIVDDANYTYVLTPIRIN